MSIICTSVADTNADVNLVSAQTELREKLQEINPAVGFYRELFEGWNSRLSYAKGALEQLPITDKRSREILSELVSVASRESSNASTAYNSLAKIRTALEAKIQDLDFLALKNKNHPAMTLPAFDIKDIRRILHASDALLELRDSRTKEVVS